MTGKTEDEVLAAIKSLAVREENAMVARVALNNMRQDQDELSVPSGPESGARLESANLSLNALDAEQKSTIPMQSCEMYYAVG